jgi:hypothetical protein
MKAEGMESNRSAAEQLGLAPEERQRLLAELEAHLDARIAERRRAVEARRAEAAAREAARRRELDAIEALAAPARAALAKHQAAAAQPWSRSTHLAYPAAGLLAFAFVPRRLRRRPCQLGHCRRCGYDLTGNVSGVCPECGSPVATSGAA